MNNVIQLRPKPEPELDYREKQLFRIQASLEKLSALLDEIANIQSSNNSKVENKNTGLKNPPITAYSSWRV